MIFVQWIQDPATKRFYFKRGTCHWSLIRANMPASQHYDEIPRGWFEIKPSTRVDVFEYAVIDHHKGWDAWQDYRKSHPRTRDLPMHGHLIGVPQADSK